MDYRKLKNKTVKENFPIFVVEELFDEVAGAIVFTNLGCMLMM